METQGYFTIKTTGRFAIKHWDLTKKHGDSNGDFMRFSLWCHSDFIQFQCVIYSDGISWVLDGLNGALVRQIPRANSGVAMSLTGENWRM